MGALSLMTPHPTHEDLRRIAEAATPGPWLCDEKKQIGTVSDADDQSYGMLIPHADAYSHKDADFIAVFNPATALSLLNSLAAKDAEIAELREEIAEIDKAVTKAGAPKLTLDDTTLAGRVEWLENDLRRLHREKCNALYGSGYVDRSELASLRERMGKVKAIKEWIPPEIRHWNRKREFCAGHPSTFKEREAKALEDLRKQGDFCEIVINEGDWSLLMHAFRALRAALAKGKTGEEG